MKHILDAKTKEKEEEVKELQRVSNIINNINAKMAEEELESSRSSGAASHQQQPRNIVQWTAGFAATLPERARGRFWFVLFILKGL